MCLSQITMGTYSFVNYYLLKFAQKVGTQKS